MVRMGMTEKQGIHGSRTYIEKARHIEFAMGCCRIYYQWESGIQDDASSSLRDFNA
jgi:hypothetical protein